MSTIKPSELGDAIAKTLKEWAGVTEEAVVKGLEESARKAAEKLQSASPAGAGRWGSWNDYNSGWDVKRESSNKTGKSSYIVHNSKHYQLTHLLENGHLLRNGGRAKAFVHIAPVAEEAEKELLETIQKHIDK